MDLDELSLRTTSLLRKAGLANVPLPMLAGICAIGIILVCLAAWQFWPRPSDSFALTSTKPTQSSSTSTQLEAAEDQQASIIVVDVEGEVANPGLYELAAESRVGDAVSAAGGLTPSASPGAINLAQKLSDGEQVRIPKEGEQSGVQTSSPVTTSPSEDGKVNINTATPEELQKLSGIGPSLSERIVDYREANGRFSSIEELQKVSGIGETRFKNLKDKICV